MLAVLAAIGLSLVVPASAHARFAKKCLAACAPQLEACRGTCGEGFGVSPKACRKAIVRRCRKLGVDVACAGTGATTTTTLPCAGQHSASADIDWDPEVPDPLVHVKATGKPCVGEALLEVGQSSPGDPSQVCLSYFRLGQSFGGPTAGGIRCERGEHVPDADRDDTFCVETSAPADCFATSTEEVTALRLRDLPPWLDVAQPFVVFVTTDAISVYFTVD